MVNYIFLEDKKFERKSSKLTRAVILIREEIKWIGSSLWSREDPLSPVSFPQRAHSLSTSH